MQFGVIGCGRIAQIMHLPHLDELPGISIEAIADPAANIRETIGDKYRVPARYSDGLVLVDELADELDGIVVATPPQAHREVGVAALEADLNILIEKPLALTEGDADALVAAANTSDAVAMVGYMKRHDPTYLRLQEMISTLDEINRIVGTLVLGQHDEIIDEIYDLTSAELDEEFLEESDRTRFEQAATAIGSEDPGLTSYYQSHLGASCHDLNALRGLFGDIDRIDHVDLHADHDVLQAYLVFEDGRRCVFTSSFNKRKEWEEFIRVETSEKTLTLEFSNPYVKNDPFELHVKRGRDELGDRTIRASYEESFKCEMERFIDSIRGEAEVRTTFEEGRNDVTTFIQLFRRYIDGR